MMQGYLGAWAPEGASERETTGGRDEACDAPDGEAYLRVRLTDDPANEGPTDGGLSLPRALPERDRASPHARCGAQLDRRTRNGDERDACPADEEEHGIDDDER